MKQFLPNQNKETFKQTKWGQLFPYKKKQKYFLSRPFTPVDQWKYYRAIGKKRLSLSAQMKLEWIIFYYTAGKKNLAYTASHFDITHCTLRKWIKRFNKDNLTLLEEQSRRPARVRTSLLTRQQEMRLMQLRKRYMTLGKDKLEYLYQVQYGETVSTSTIGRFIKKRNLFPYSTKKKERLRVRRNMAKKIRIHHMKEKLKKQSHRFGYLWHVDTITVWWSGNRRYIITAIEESSRFGFARVYPGNTSTKAEDFLKRLLYLVNAKIEIIHTDNGSEFAGAFEKACTNLGITQIYSRPHTPKDNAKLERFNNTIQYEWLAMSPVGHDILEEANNDLAQWLVFYNSIRPHQAIGHMTPLEHIRKNADIKDTMLWTSTTYCVNVRFLLA